MKIFDVNAEIVRDEANKMSIEVSTPTLSKQKRARATQKASVTA